MNSMENIDKNSSEEMVINELCKLFVPYAQELLYSGGDFSYMNMYADNFKDALLAQTSFDEFAIFEILNEACDKSWKMKTQ